MATENGLTAFAMAITPENVENNFELLELLSHANMNPKQLGEFIFVAISYASQALFDLLLRRNADVNVGVKKASMEGKIFH